MGMYEVASGNAVWRGLDYYKDNKVISCTQIEKDIYEGEVRGSGAEPYHVHIDIKHPKRSVCNCPFAEGRRVVCKHMMAMYYTVFPDEVDRPEREWADYEAEEEIRMKQEEEDRFAMVMKMSKAELQAELLAAWSELDDLKKNRW